MKYRKKPNVVEATQWFPDRTVPGVSIEEVYAEIAGRDGWRSGPIRQPDKHYVTTIHGQRAYLAPGDWVITEPDGIHHYPCKPDVFEATYDPVEATQ